MHQRETAYIYKYENYEDIYAILVVFSYSLNNVCLIIGMSPKNDSSTFCRLFSSFLFCLNYISDTVDHSIRVE